MSITAKIDAHELQDLITAVDTLGGAITGEDVRMIMGRAIVNTLRDHFAELAQDSVHHKSAEALGATPTGFYEEAMRSVQQPELESDGVSVSINQVGIAQRLFGGTIKAEPGHFLTIPARTETYGKRAREFDNLRLIIFPSGSGALVERDASTITRRGKKSGEVGGLVYFWLVRQVTQPPDPTVLPEDSEMLDAVFVNAQRFIESVWDEGRSA